MRLVFVAIGTLLALASAQTALAVETFYLKIPGITGDSHGLIPVNSFSDSITNTFNAASGQSARPSCSPLQVVKELDNSSPELFMSVASGHVYKTIELEAFTTNGGAGGMLVMFLHLTLTNAVISAVSLGGDVSGSARTETVTINSEKIEVQYTPLRGETGGTPPPAMVTCGGAAD